MRGIIAIVLAVVVVGGGYYWYVSQKPDAPVVVAPAPAPVPESAPETAPETAPVPQPEAVIPPTPVPDAAEENSGDTSEQPATEPAQDGVQSSDEGVDRAPEVIETAPVDDGTVDEAPEGATQESDAADEPAAADEGEPAATADAMTVEGFDYDRVIATIDESDMDTTQKTALRLAVSQARDNPALLNEVLARLRAAIGQ